MSEVDALTTDLALGLLKWAQHTDEGYHSEVCRYTMRWKDDPESICDCGLWGLKERARAWLQKTG